MHRGHWQSVVAAGLAAAVSWDAALAQTLTRVVKTGDPAPGRPGEYFWGLEAPFINDVRQLVFVAYIGETAMTSRGSIWVWPAIGAPAGPLVVEGDPAPGGGEFRRFGALPSINRFGKVGFAADVFDAGVTTGGYWVGSLAGGFQNIASNGDPAPGGGTFTGLNPFPEQRRRVHLNDSDKVMFWASPDGLVNGVWAGTAGGTLDRIMLEGAAAPDAPGYIIGNSDIIGIDLNRRGDVAAAAYAYDPSGPNDDFYGVWIGATTPIPLAHTATGAIADGVFLDEQGVAWYSQRERYNNGTCEVVQDSQRLTNGILLAEGGVQAPDVVPPQDYYTVSDCLLLNEPFYRSVAAAANDRGDRLFPAYLETPGDHTNGLWLYVVGQSEPTLVALDGQAAWGGVSGEQFVNFGTRTQSGNADGQHLPLAINYSRSVVFEAQVNRNGGSTLYSALFAGHPLISQEYRLIGEGDLRDLDGEGVADDLVDDVQLGSGGDRYSRYELSVQDHMAAGYGVITSCGVVAFKVAYTDTSESSQSDAIFITTIPNAVCAGEDDPLGFMRRFQDRDQSADVNGDGTVDTRDAILYLSTYSQTRASGG